MKLVFQIKMGELKNFVEEERDIIRKSFMSSFGWFILCFYQYLVFCVLEGEKVNF
jgi:hypothetical protein